MKELIKITEKGTVKLVSARELYQFLGYNAAHWARWSKKNIVDNEFAIDKFDYEALTIEVNGNKTTDYSLKMDFAKKLSMMAKTEKGEIARGYFIRCEKHLKQHSIPQSYSEALQLAANQAKKIELQKEEIKVLEPKAEFYDAVTESKTGIDMGNAAKILDLGFGRNRLFEKLRNLNILMHNNKPYQTFVDRGYFRLVETKFEKPDGSTHINIKTLVHQKGLDYIRKQLNNL